MGHLSIKKKVENILEKTMADTQVPPVIEVNEDDSGILAFLDNQDTQLGIGTIELGIATLCCANMFWHLCAQNWTLCDLVMNLLMNIAEFTASIMLIAGLVQKMVVDGEVVEGKLTYLSTTFIISAIAACLVGIRVIWSIFKSYSMKKESEFEGESAWMMFWPLFELILSLISCICLLAIINIVYMGFLDSKIQWDEA